MRSTYFSLATAALCWTGVALASSPAENGIPNDALLARRPRVIQNRHRNATAAAAELSQLVGRQDGGRCGSGVGRCPDGQCCSDYGFCGLTVDHCHPLFDCQEQYGVCGWPPPEPPRPSTSSTPPVVIPSSTSTPPVIIPSSTSTPPPVISSTSTTIRSTSSSTPPVVIPSSTAPVIPQPSGELVITSNGRCGNNTICVGNPNYGPCCSNHFWCGSSLEYCGAGCQSQFGACLGVPGIPGGPINNGTSSSVPVVVPSSTSSPPVVIPSSTSSPPVVIPSSTSTPPVIIPSSTRTTSSAAPTPTLVLPPGQRSSTDGRCGNGQNCLGSTFGRCCSQFGWCGDGDQFCPFIVGCQSEFGYCDPA
ncbi:hypothetical protein QBC35DRAFT_517912 [Podospora australis]|uniref:Chitin-binding type-1 domain-containing protein n=1 Tax=Podospora australis TaxID=1536484 RepID=A0AAN7AER9_9PEZI|nr:hypothetical protein QBC35DRAFT_517912 [Podospora australis]